MGKSRYYKFGGDVRTPHICGGSYCWAFCNLKRDGYIISIGFIPLNEKPYEGRTIFFPGDPKSEDLHHTYNKRRLKCVSNIFFSFMLKGFNRNQILHTF